MIAAFGSGCRYASCKDFRPGTKAVHTRAIDVQGKCFASIHRSCVRNCPQQCSLSIARHTRTSANITTRLPRHDWGQDARTSLIDTLHSTRFCSKPDAVVAVCSSSSTKSEKSTAVVDNQAAHNQDDWQTQRRSKRPKRAKNPIVPAPTRKQTLTLIDLWGKKKDKTDQTKKATGADTDKPERGFQGRIPASSEEAEIESNGPSQVLQLEPNQHETNSAVTCTSDQHKQQACSLPREDNKDKALADPAIPCSPSLSPHRVHKASPNKTRPDTGIARRRSQPGKPAESLTILTWNVMGLTTVMHELKQLILSHSPDVIVITETKLNKKNCNSRVIKDIFEDYTLFHSCNAPVDPLRREANPGSLDRNGAGGVTVAIKDLWCSSGSAKLIPNTGKFLQSHCVCVDLHPPNSDPLLICGTYMPFDRAQRNNIYAHLQKVMQTYQHTVLAGDWNAALYTTDRSLQEDAELIDDPSRMALDNMHEGFVRDTSLHPIDPVNECLGECRARTFRSNRADANGSRIDDVLTSTALRDGANYLQFPDCNGDSDHNPILAAITTKSLTLIPPPPALPDQPKSPRFKTPMKAEELTKFREILSLTAGRKGAA